MTTECNLAEVCYMINTKVARNSSCMDLHFQPNNQSLQPLCLTVKTALQKLTALSLTCLNAWILTTYFLYHLLYAIKGQK